MINYVKGFGQFINEARFHHALPNSAGETRTARLRDEFRALSPEEQGEIERLAADLEKKGIFNDFKKTMSSYNSIAQVKDSMSYALDMGYDETEEAESRRLKSTGGWDIRLPSNDDESIDKKGSGYYYSDKDEDSEGEDFNV
jgi:hypothetical protein